jgi:hypothetical protein
MNRKHSTTAPRPESHWQGSLKTAVLVKAQIAERYGEEEAANYDPTKNCFTFNTWRAKGYKVKKGEKALRSYTLIAEQEHIDGLLVNGDEQEPGVKHLKGVCLFYILQVEKREDGIVK